MEYILLVVVFIPLMVSIFLNSISTLLNERLTTFITINGALLSFTVSLFMFGVLLLDKFKPISLKLYTWFPEPEIRFEFLLDGLSGTMRDTRRGDAGNITTTEEFLNASTRMSDCAIRVRSHAKLVFNY